MATSASQDVNVLKRAAKNAVVKNLIELNDAVSIDEGTFRNIVHGCTNTLIAIAFSKELTETVAIPVTQRAGRFINYLSTTVGFKYDHLDTFLVVLCKYGGVCGTEAAKGVAKDYGYKLPKYEAYITDSSNASDTHVVHDEITGAEC
jgi:formyltetrahydrofolate synthetase